MSGEHNWHNQRSLRTVAELVLPYPLSANKYWRSITINGQARVLVSKDAIKYKRAIQQIVFNKGITSPFRGRMAVTIWLYPHRPLDAKARIRKDGTSSTIDPDWEVHGWDDDVACIDLDNARKVLYDSIKGNLIEDDKWIWMDSARRMEPDEHGKRVIVRVQQLVRTSPQQALVA